MTTLKNGSFEHSSKSKLLIKRRKKNDYVKLEAGAYPRMFLQQLEEAATALASDNLSITRMIRRDKRSGSILVTMGFGKRNTWFENGYLTQGEVAECEDTNEALNLIYTFTKAAKAGEFDRALEELRIQRQEHAETMIEARDRCGFHQKTAREPAKPQSPPKADAEAYPSV